MRFGILGSLEARRADGGAISVGGSRLRALLALLLLDAGRVVTTERLIAGLYGEGGATNALQSQVSRLRREFEVEFHPAGYRLVVDAQEVDCHLFERLVREGRAAASAQARSALLGEALALWRGPALADVREAPFAAGQAARLEELRLDAIEERVEADLALGGHRELVAELRELVAAHPVRERPRGQLIRALYAGGRQSEALAAYEDARRTLAEELGVDPSPELAAIHLAVLRGELPTSVRVTVSQRLPAQLTSFVGRQEELARIGGLLTEGRLVTLTGPGGAGKTRLAVEAAAREAGEVCFVELGPLVEGDAVAQAVLAALGGRDGGLRPGQEQRQPDPAGRLVAALADRPLLLVLDNCEHVVDDAARLAHHLLSACPDLRILATSREALGITGETLCAVPLLALPAEGADPAQALASPAVRLFADRAAAVRAGFAVDDGNLASVLAICGALDGLPLAIELAAARLRALTPAEVAARLADRFALLSRGSRTAQPRHKTLRAVVEWSWDLLDERERTLARRLSVFVGGATLQAAEQVCALPGTDAVLASLVDKSLVELTGDRYRMLATIHAFCAEKLTQAGESAELSRAHAEFYLALLGQAAPGLLGAEQLRWLERLDAEDDDLLAALRWAAAADPGLGLRLCAEVSPYLWMRGRRGEGTAPARALLGVLGADLPPGQEGDYVICVLSAAAGGSLDPWLREHLLRARQLMHDVDLIAGSPLMGFLWGNFSGPDERGFLKVMKERLEASPHPWTRALMSLGFGLLSEMVEGDVEQAEREFTRAVAAFGALGERWGMTMALTGLLQIAAWRGERDRFTALTDEALRLVGELGAVEDLADVHCRRGDGRILMSDLDGAQADYTRAGELARRVGALDAVVEARFGLAQVARLRGREAAARAEFERLLADTSAASFGDALLLARIPVALGWIAVAEGDVASARARQAEALAAVPAQSRPVLALVVEGLAGVVMAEGDAGRAALLLGAGRALRGISPSGDTDVLRVAERAVGLLGEAAYRAAFARGAALTRDEAVAEAERATIG